MLFMVANSLSIMRMKMWICMSFFFPVRFGCQRLTLQKGRGCRHRLRNTVHAVDGLEEFWDTIVLIRNQHLNL